MIVVIGEILIDMFQDYQRIGGAPFNFAFHLIKLGFPVRFLTRVGNDRRGGRIVEMLTKNGFNEADIQVDSTHPTGTVNVQLDAQGVPTFDICENVAYDYLDLTQTDALDTDAAEMIYFGSLLQRTNSGHRQVQGFLSRKTDRLMCFCDINMRSPHVNTDAVAGSLYQADLLKVNDAELADIQRMFEGPAAAGEVMPWLMQTFKISAVSLTRGSRGSRFYNRDGRINSPAMPETPVVDTVGAGDGFAAILAAGCMQQIPWAVTIHQASAFAARICGIAGAVPDDEHFYDDFRLLKKGGVNGR